jgi:hypothetical protein
MDSQENAPKPREIFRQALAAFLAARVPDAKVRTGERFSRYDQMGDFVLDEQARVVNEFRDAVLKGRE